MGRPPDLATLGAAAAVAAFLVAFIKNAIGGGIGLVVTPILTLVLPPRTVLGLTAILLNLANPFALRFFWRRWDGRLVRVLLPTTLAGILAGGYAMSFLSDAALRRMIGVAVLAGALFQLGVLAWRSTRPVPVTLLGFDPPRELAPRGTLAGGMAVGLVSGVASVAANAGGLLVGPYLAGLGLPNASVVGTGTAVVVVADLVKVATYGQIGFLTWQLLAVALASVPLLALGAWLGYRLNRRLPRMAVTLTLIGIAIVGSLRLLLA
jgi:uncharacterized membrane protein YfcA